jgi:hypothetical protein
MPHQVTLHRLGSSFAEPEVVQFRADRVGMPFDLDAEGGLGAGEEQPSDVPRVTCALLPGR